MSRLKLTSEIAKAAVLGGTVLGGGGGGDSQTGIKLASLAVNFSAVELIDINDLPEDSMLINVSAVGAPASKEAYAEPIYYYRAVEILRKFTDMEIKGIITNEEEEYLL